jgi:Bacterial regulatory proteins, luxR family
VRRVAGRPPEAGGRRHRARDEPARLTTHEQWVARLAAAGHSTKNIAAQLTLSVKTIEFTSTLGWILRSILWLRRTHATDPGPTARQPAVVLPGLALGDVVVADRVESRSVSMVPHSALARMTGVVFFIDDRLRVGAIGPAHE